MKPFRPIKDFDCDKFLSEMTRDFGRQPSMDELAIVIEALGSGCTVVVRNGIIDITDLELK